MSHSACHQQLLGGTASIVPIGLYDHPARYYFAFYSSKINGRMRHQDAACYPAKKSADAALIDLKRRRHGNMKTRSNGLLTHRKSLWQQKVWCGRIDYARCNDLCEVPLRPLLSGSARLGERAAPVKESLAYVTVHGRCRLPVFKTRGQEKRRRERLAVDGAVSLMVLSTGTHRGGSVPPDWKI